MTVSTGYASIASPSEPVKSWVDAVSDVNASRTVATASDVEFAPLVMTNNSPVLMSSVGTVTNTVNRGNVVVWYGWFDANNQWHDGWQRVSNDGSFSLSFDGTLNRITFQFPRTALPVAGNYLFSFDFASDFSCNYNSPFIETVYSSNNVASTTKSYDCTDYFSSSSGDFCLSSVPVAIGSNTTAVHPFGFSVFVNGIRDHFSGSFRARFDLYNGSEVVVDRPGGSSIDTQADYQYSVTDSLGSIGDTLAEIVKTISNQLEALWNQMYNFMHLPQYQKLEEIRQAIENIRLDVDVDNQDVVNKLDEQIANDNANTTKVEKAVEKHGNFIIEGLKSLFIPDDEYFSSLFDRLHQFFSDRLGFLYVPFDLLIRLLDAIKGADTAFAGIPFPGIQAGEWVLLEPTIVTFDILNEFPELVSALHFITSVVMIGAFLNLLHRKMEEVMSR